jgi:hypothetical protein
LKAHQYILKNLERSDYPQWNDFVRRQSASGTLFHTAFWADTIKEVFHRSYKITVILKNNEIKSGILYWPKSGIIPSLTHVPLTPYQGIIHETPDPSKKISAIKADIHKRSNLLLDFLKKEYAFINFPLSVGIDDVRYYKWNNFSAEPSYTYLINLHDKEQIMARFNQSLRRKIKISEKQNLAVVRSNDIDPITRFVMDSYRVHQTSPPISAKAMKRFLQRMLENDTGRIYYLRKEGESVCGLVILLDDKHVYALFSGINTRFRDTQFTQYLHAAVMLMTEFQGRIFDFLGANTEHLEQFKRSFGGELHQFYRVLYYKNPLIRSIFNLRTFQHHAYRKLARFVK